MTLIEGLELETSLFSQLMGTEDKREGIAAFLEKRKPVFKGK
jgi:enoyl-CoA hydratase/carnithine racemase